MSDYNFYLHDAVHILRSNGTTEHADACAWAVTEIERLRNAERLMITLATHSQGGHSETGAEIAELLGVPFPLNMDALSAAATARGYDPDAMWPWLKKMRAERSNSPTPETVSGGNTGDGQ